jgi:hypothetical protein
VEEGVIDRIVPTSTAKGTATMLLLAALILALGGCAGVGKEEVEEEEITAGETTTVEAARTTVELSPSRNSGVSGTAILTEIAGEVVAVELEMRNLLDEPGALYLVHIHEGGTCADDRADNGAPIKYPLDPIIVRQTETTETTRETTEPGVTTTSTSTLEGVTEGFTLDRLLSGPPKYINVHARSTGGASLPPGVSCGDLPVRQGETTRP